MTKFNRHITDRDISNSSGPTAPTRRQFLAGTTAGLPAASRAGAKTMLVERQAFVGGHATADLMNCYHGFRNQKPPNRTQTAKGIPAEIVSEIHKAGGTSLDVSYRQQPHDLDAGQLTYCAGLDPEVVKYVQLKMPLAARSDCLPRHVPIDQLQRLLRDQKAELTPTLHKLLRRTHC